MHHEKVSRKSEPASVSQQSNSHCFDATAKRNGFTIIELVIIIFILSVISVVAMSRFGSPNSFTGLVARDQIITLSRMAQQSAFGRSGVTMTFTPNVAGDQATIELSAVVSAASETLESVTVPISSLTINGDINDTDSCTTTTGAFGVTNGAPLNLRFGELGDLVASSGVAGGAGEGTVTSALRICINDDINYSVCIAPTGFAYAGDCDVDP